MAPLCEMEKMKLEILLKEFRRSLPPVMRRKLNVRKSEIKTTDELILILSQVVRETGEEMMELMAEEWS